MNTPVPKPLILIIDDEPQIRRLLRLTLETAEFAVLEAETGAAALTQIAAHPPDAVVLDLGLPDLGGVEVLRRLRGWSQVPVIVVTVLAEEEEKVRALDAGADDYVTKPFGTSELMARLRAMLRRGRESAAPAAVRFGPIEIDLAARLVRRDGAEVRLTGKEYALLGLLAKHRGKVLTHRQILRELWGPRAEGNSHYLRVHMAHLRQKLEPDPHHPHHLKTESGIGYRLVVD